MRIATLAIAGSVIGVLLVGAAIAVETATVDPIQPASIQQLAFEEEAVPEAEACCSDSYRCCCRPQWTVKAGAMWLNREGTRGIPFVVAPNDIPFVVASNSSVLASTADLGFGSEPGYYFTLLRHTQRGWDLEVTHFNVTGWNESSTFGAVPNWSVIPVVAPTINVTNNVGPNSMRYTSELFSTEINLRRPLSDRVTVLAGFRIVELHEQFIGALQGPVSLSQYFTNTDNHMYGFQLGADMDLWSKGRLSVNGVLKGGIYGNAADQDSILTDTAMGIVVGPAVDQTDHTAFLGEVAFILNYQLTNRLSLTAGYQLMWIEGAALATEQIPVTNYATNSGISVHGSPFYHGVNVGLKCTW